MVLDTPQSGGLRMEADTWTVDEVVAAVLADERLDMPRDRCGVLAALSRWSYIDAPAYAAAGGGVCSSYAVADYPWSNVAAAPAR